MNCKIKRYFGLDWESWSNWLLYLPNTDVLILTKCLLVMTRSCPSRGHNNLLTLEGSSERQRFYRYIRKENEEKKKKKSRFFFIRKILRLSILSLI